MRPTRERLFEILDAMSGRKVTVLADLVADEYLFCRTNRISREAPAALILRYEARELRLGGGANAVANLSALDAQVAVVGVVGDDDVGRELVAALAAQKIDASGIVVDSHYRTVVKSRVLTSYHHSTRQQVLRIDREDEVRAGSATCSAVGARLRQLGETAEALLVSDYGYGAASPALVRTAIAAARSRGIPTTVDSRYRILEHGGVGAATPNEPEAEAALGIEIGDDLDRLAWAGTELLTRLGAGAVLITRGSKGMALFEPGNGMLLIPVHGSDEIADVTGAGDTVIATFTLALSAGASHREAAHLANVAGGIVVMKLGTAVVTRAELRSALAGW